MLQAYVLNNPANLIDPSGLCPGDGDSRKGTGCAKQSKAGGSNCGVDGIAIPCGLAIALLQGGAAELVGLPQWAYQYIYSEGGNYVDARPLLALWLGRLSLGGGGNSSAQTQACGTSGFHGGVGITGGANADLGLAVAGATASGSGGGGLFYDSKTGFSDGLFATGAAVPNFFSHVAAAPSQSVQPGILGAYAGAGGSIFITNAGSVQQLSGPFTTYSLNVGVGPYKFSVQYASGGSIKVLSIGPPYVGVSIGASITRIVTNTVTQQRGCK